MEVLKEDPILTFPADTLKVVRKTYNLDKPGAMDTAIDILQLWLKKQDHFIFKDFSREYLERCIIRSKGSIERAKERLDRLCTGKTLMPNYFVNCNVKDFTKLDILTDVLLPKLTKDYYRVYILRNVGQEFDSVFYDEYYLRMFHFLEYLFKHDYCNGVVTIFDFTKINLMEMVKTMDIVQLGQISNLLFKAYSLRMKSIHIISSSKVINLFVNLMKQVVSEKIGNRIQVHKELDTLYEHVEKDILPEEYGGKEISMDELSKKWVDLLSSDSFMEYMKTMNAAKTNEALRRNDDFKNQYLGMPGTFRTLSVD